MLTVEVPAYIDLIHNKVRAMFVNWSDGQKYTNRSNSIERNVTLHNDIDLFALYKTQYRLLVNSSRGDPNGTSWYDTGNQGHFSVKPLTDWFWLQKFDHWTGDISDQITQPSGSLTMDAPKIINAIYDYDFTHLAIILAGVGSLVTILEIVLKRQLLFFSKLKRKVRRPQKRLDEF